MTALGIDLLAPEGYGEIIGGGERAASLEYLESNSSKHHGLPTGRHSSGTSTSAATAASRTPASAWASNAAPPGCAASNTSARRFRFRGCCIG